MTPRLQIPLFFVGCLVLAAAPVSAEPDYSQALEQQQQRLLEAPSAATWNDLGSLLLLTGDEVEAAGAFEQALALEPENPAALYNLGVLRLESDPARARKLLRSALEISEDGWTHYRLGQVYELLHRERKAIEHYTRAFELDQRLLYPEVNPEIIENRLVTRSLLAVRNHDGPRIEPRFVDTGAMRTMLLHGDEVMGGGDRAMGDGVMGDEVMGDEGDEVMGDGGDDAVDGDGS